MAYLKFKACRRLGENIWWHNKKLTPKQNTIIKLVIKKNTSRKQSDFSKKLQQLKKLAYFYGMRSLNNRATSSADRSLRSRLDKKKSLLLTLETRLDVILVRLYFCSTLFAARQLITHNKIRVNLNVVNLPGFTVRNGDIISIADDHREAVTVSATAARLRLVDLVKSKIKHLTVGRRRSHSLRSALLRPAPSSPPGGPPLKGGGGPTEGRRETIISPAEASLIFDRSALTTFGPSEGSSAVRLSAAAVSRSFVAPKGEAPNEAPNGAPNVDRDSGQVIVSASGGRQIIVSASLRSADVRRRQNMSLFSTGSAPNVRLRSSSNSLAPFVAIRERPFTGVGGLYHFEVNYKTFYAVLLYEPIQIHFPYKIDFDLLF